MRVTFDQTIYGDYVHLGNAVLGCPRDGVRRHPPGLCGKAQDRQGKGVSAQNNGHHMVWVDVDGDEATYNSSSATLTLPTGATVAYATLSWAATTGAPPTTPCGRSSHRPPGSPEEQAVSLAVGGRAATSLGPPRFTMTVDPLDSLQPTDQQFYSARADVTEQLRGIMGGTPTTVTVGNIWTPQGPDCFAGWSLVVVWRFDSPTPGHAPARNHVIVYDGHLRMRTGMSHLPVHIDSLRAAGGRSRLGVTAYEGDWAVPGDQLLINGVAQADPAGGGTDNFFSSYAEGRRSPDAVNNMSVDAKTVSVPDTVIRPADTTARLTFTSRSDAYLVQTVAVSLPMPELTAIMSVDRSVTYAGEPVQQTVQVSNVGQAIAHSIRVHVEGNPGCVHNIDRIPGGASATVTCADTARPDDYQTTALVSGSSLAGDPVTTQATVSVEVIHPALEVTQRVDPAVALTGQTIHLQVETRNTGDTLLSDLAIDHTPLDACDHLHPEAVAPGQSIVIDCAVTAGDDNVTNTVAVSGSDKLAARTTATATADYVVVHPRLVMSAVWSADAVPAGEQVTITVALSNPGPLTISDVQVSGEPTECNRAISILHPGQTVDYTCSVTMTRDMSTELVATGTPLLDGHAVDADLGLVRTIATARVVIQLIPETPPSALPLTEPVQPRPVQPDTQPAPVPATTRAEPLSRPAVTTITIAIAMIGMCFVTTATSAIRKR